LLIALHFIWQGVSTVASKCATSSWNPNNNEESTSSYKSQSLKIVTPKGKVFRSSSNNEVVFECDLAASGSKCDVSENLTHKNNAAHHRLHNSENDDNVSVTCAIINCLTIIIYKGDLRDTPLHQFFMK
jgi:hypothetical protein